MQLRLSETYPFEVTVNHTLPVHVNQAPCDVCQLQNHVIVNERWDTKNIGGKLTSSSRFASKCSFTNSLMSPFDIHFETIANSVADIATPSSGNTFG